MWTEITRSDYERRGGRYASDMTDREWALLVPFMPARKKNGRPRTTAMRDVMDAILYMAAISIDARLCTRFWWLGRVIREISRLTR